jgi:hypothetical protein
MTGKRAWNKGLTSATDPRVAAGTEQLKKTLAETGKLVGAALWTTEERRAHALRCGFGGYQPMAGRSKKYRVVDSFGKEVLLQSSYELRCMEILNSLSIRWIRPKCLKYDNRRYFADFYLVDYDIYLDPKNPYKARLDVEKINKVIDQNQVMLHVLLEEDLTEDKILSLVSPSGEGTV